MSSRSREALGTSQTMGLAGIEVELTRKRVKNVNLRVKADGRILLSAPPGVPLAELDRFVASKRDWIERSRRKAKARAQQHSSGYLEGDTLYRWGTPLALHIETHGYLDERMSGTFYERGDMLVLDIDERLATDDERGRDARGQLIRNWRKILMMERVPTSIEHCEAIVTKRCSGWRLRAMKSRWGSCNVRTRMITLNTELAAYPPECLDYVVTHELCHLWEPSHNERFHSLMDGFYPHWRAVREQLKHSPAELC